jgi:hypothetical protein
VTSAPPGAATRPSFAGLATALAIALTLAILRVVLRADGARAYLLGHPIDVGCAFHTRTGLPCPMCGVTRSVAMTLHGDLSQAFALFPTAPVVSFGLAALCAALVADFVLRARRSTLVTAFDARLRRGALVYGALCGLLWLADWTARVGTALTHG